MTLPERLPKGVQLVTKRRKDGSVAKHYYWRANRAKLPDPSSPDFAAAVEKARYAPAELPPTGTFKALLLEYKRSPGFRNLEPKTQRAYARRIDLVRRFEPLLVADIRRGDLLALRDAVALKNGPQAANHLMMVMAVLMQFAVEREWREANPLARIKRLKGGEHKRWSDAAIAYALTHLPKEHRRAVLLALYTGQREGDCIAMKWSQYDGTAIAVTPGKTVKTTGVSLWIPCHKILRAELDKWPRTAETILTTTDGHPWRGGSFATRFSTILKAHAPLKGLVFHGLRKASAARLAEAGCSTHEIAAITGHATLAMVEHYTKEADQKRRATAAITKLELVSENRESVSRNPTSK